MTIASKGELEEEIIPAQLLDLGEGGFISRPRTQLVGEDIVPGRNGLGTDQDTFSDPDENHLVSHTKGLDPLLREPDPAPWFDCGRLGRIHDPLNVATPVKVWK